MHELRYFQEIISFSDDVNILWLEKCDCIVNKKVRWFEALKIYFEGREVWLFDYLPTMEQASRIVAESCFTNFDAVKCRKGMVKNVV